ncbi:hypothetical protein ACGGAQ_29515 [Micromonospora sp. NPDC047557]|uniref:hypothetical protein n=1 Tax=Micromonospora sp. NPDC047557 TaxID=3364250 RepID=UPI003711713D
MPRRRCRGTARAGPGDLARVLRVDPELLLGQPRSTPAGTPDGVDDIRAALARYDTPHAPSS